MAYIIADSKFTPFTYEERIKPLQDYLQKAEKVEATYLTELDELAKIGSTLPEGAKLSDTYKALEDKLTTSRDKLYTEGLTPELKRELNNLRLEADKFKSSAITQYNQYIKDKERRQGIVDRLGENNVIFNTPDITLDSYSPITDPETGKLVSPDIDLGYINLLEEEARAATFASSIAKQYSNRKIIRDESTLPGQIIETSYDGLTPEEVTLEDESVNPTIQQWVRDTYGDDMNPILRERVQHGLYKGSGYKENRKQYSAPIYDEASWKEYQKYMRNKVFNSGDDSNDTDIKGSITYRPNDGMHWFHKNGKLANSTKTGDKNTLLELYPNGSNSYTVNDFSAASFGDYEISSDDFKRVVSKELNSEFDKIYKQITGYDPNEKITPQMKESVLNDYFTIEVYSGTSSKKGTDLAYRLQLKPGGYTINKKEFLQKIKSQFSEEKTETPTNSTATSKNAK